MRHQQGLSFNFKSMRERKKLALKQLKIKELNRSWGRKNDYELDKKETLI